MNKQNAEIFLTMLRKLKAHACDASFLRKLKAHAYDASFAKAKL
jgi:hypothetical protein